jgi:hypothetical protein
VEPSEEKLSEKLTAILEEIHARFLPNDSD